MNSPVELLEKVAEYRTARRFLFWAFVISVVFIHITYTYILYRQYDTFLTAMNTQFNCKVEQALERETARYILRRTYLEPTPETMKKDIGLYNFWRVWVLSMPVMIAIAIFMIIRYGFEVIPPYSYLFLTIVVLYLGVYQIVHLPRDFGFPSYWDIFADKMMNGEIHRAIQYHTQGYDQIHALFESRLGPCLADEAEYSCMELLPSAFRAALLQRYTSVNPDTNAYQAADFFEASLKKRDYDAVIGYMRLGNTSNDLELLSGLETTGGSTGAIDDEALNTFRSNFSKELINEVYAIFQGAFWKLLVPGWILIIYFVWFHRAYQGTFGGISSMFKANDDIDPFAYLFWILVLGIWILLLGMF
jgi:hypothetical protein